MHTPMHKLTAHLGIHCSDLTEHCGRSVMFLVWGMVCRHIIAGNQDDAIFHLDRKACIKIIFGHGLCFFRTWKKSLRENNCLVKGCRCVVTQDITALSWDSPFTRERRRAKLSEGRVYTFFPELVVFIRETQFFVEFESWRYSENSYFICWSQCLQLWYVLHILISSVFIDQLDIIHRPEKHSWAEPGLFLDIVQKCFGKAEVLSSSSGLKRPGGALYLLWAESSEGVHWDVNTEICPFQYYWNRFPYPLKYIAIYVRNHMRKSGYATYTLCLK